MNNYKKILVAVDLADGTREVVERARDIAALHGAELSILHVVEYMPVEPMGEAILPPVNLEDDVVRGARKRLEATLEEAGLGTVPHECVVGSIKTEILRQAQAADVDLIVIGAHERHGIGVLVNLTEDAVLHAAPCDVLAVRIRG